MNNLESQMLSDKLEGDAASASQYLENFYGHVSSKDGMLYDENNQSIEGKTDMVDAILADLGDVATIFAKSGNDFIRISSNIMADDKQRVTGTLLDQNSPAYKALLGGQGYIGQADILGENHYTAYEPMRDTKGDVIGILFVGISTKDSTLLIKSLSNVLVRDSLLAIIIILVISFFSILIISKGFSNPIILMATEINKIADYDLTGKDDNLTNLVTRKDEIGSIAFSVVSL